MAIFGCNGIHDHSKQAVMAANRLIFQVICFVFKSIVLNMTSAVACDFYYRNKQYKKSRDWTSSLHATLIFIFEHVSWNCNDSVIYALKSWISIFENTNLHLNDFQYLTIHIIYQGIYNKFFYVNEIYNKSCLVLKE